MKNTSFQHALRCMGHPLLLAALGLVLLNALWLQPNAPGWLSGKLADFAWMTAAPLLLALLLALLWPENASRVGWAAILITGLLFSLLKTLPVFNTAARTAWFSLTGVPLKLTLDPTDLLALAGLAGAAFIWFRPVLPRARVYRLAGAGLTALAIMADAAGPMNLGVVCVAAQDATLYSFREREMTSGYIVAKTKTYWEVSASTDGGLTWVSTTTYNENATPDPADPPLGSLLEQCAASTPGEWLTDPQDPAVSYLVVDGDAIYRSTDGRATLTREFDLEDTDSLTSAVFDPASGNLVLGVKLGGVLVRTPTGWLRPVHEP